ncbi:MULTISPECIES: histone deacetylase [unclassified Thioalkalivibrio]|uniref:histone deacetylase family protein n=1 Tax=unclassified Thioalkalivibrio TaxID=2621013 RepID=UPI00036B7B65|nr:MULTISPECIES: histone deacetylase [unclassified Thioalkalivibrio]
MTLSLVHHPDYTIDLPDGHPFPMAKFRVLRERLETELADTAVTWLQPEIAARATLLRVHTPEYLDDFLSGRTSKAAQRRSGFQWSEALVERVRLETGGTLLTVEAALAEGLALNTAGGTHHAHAGFASGYCLINDIAVAAAHARAEGWVRRVLIVDLDVHQGDGTAAIFADTPEVVTFSMHAGTNFPARKTPGDHDIELARHTGDDAYLAALRDVLAVLLRDVRPDLVIYDAGVDVHGADRLGHLDLTDDGIEARDRHVLQVCREMATPVAAVIGGGYDRDIAALADRHAIIHRTAAYL